MTSVVRPTSVHSPSRGHISRASGRVATTIRVPSRGTMTIERTDDYNLAIPIRDAETEVIKQLFRYKTTLTVHSSPSRAKDISIHVAQRKLALLLPAHNEELLIAATIDSAIAGGQQLQDIYVVDDNSSDNTRKIAISKLGKDHVLSVKRSGKALAVHKAVKKFKLDTRYIWLHVADADSVFSKNYFYEYKRKLDAQKYAVAVGFVQSLRGNWISTYRSLTYTYSQHITRRAQSYLGMVSVFPGPVTCFRTDILSKLEFGNESLTEDFDVTLQVHRKNLGKILYIPNAVNYTQDPQTLSDFCKQNLRWQRGFFQGVKKFRIGLGRQRIDASLGLQMLQTPIFLVELLVIVPAFIILTGNWLIIPTIFAIETIVNGGIALASTAILRRWYLIGALPYFFFLRFLEIGIHLMAFTEVMVLGKFKEQTIGWGTEGRRYKLSKSALAEVS